MLGFVLRQASEFSNLQAMMVLYSSFVRSVLEYGSCVWSPYYITHINRLEKVQRKFVKRICFKFNIFYDNDRYLHILSYMAFSPLYTGWSRYNLPEEIQ
jgi:hypothetical protein